MRGKGKSSKAKKKRRNRLYAEQNGICCYCPTKMIHWGDYQSGVNFNGRVPPNGATVEHLRDRLDPTRWDTGPERRWAIACHECNNKRGRERHQALGHDELRRRSQR